MLAVLAGAFDHLVPAVGAILAIIWYALMIWDSPPVKRLFRRK